MEMLHNLWNVLCTEDENLIIVFTFILSFLEIYVILKLMAAIWNIKYTKRQRNLFFVYMLIYWIFITFIIPNQFSVFLTLFALPIIFKLVFKLSIPKIILSVLIILLSSVILESIYIRLCCYIFNISLNECSNIPIYRVPSMLIVYASIYILSKFIILIKINLNNLEHIDKHAKRIILVNLLFILICITVQFYLLLFYNNVLPIYITIISITSLIAYAMVSFYSMIKSINLSITKRELEQSELHNKTLELLYNNVSAFKHDFSNIITALGGYINSRNMDGLEKYYDKILDECNINNNLSTLNPGIINNPAIYNILASKYYRADELGITINLQVFINLNELKMDVYDFCRILGILLDNAIEASSKCEEKTINIDIRDIKPRKCQSITIENTYLDKNIDLSKLSEKGYTSKTEDAKSHGIGLWQVAKLVKKHHNIILDTSKDDTYFRQELVIYYK